MPCFISCLMSHAVLLYLLLTDSEKMGLCASHLVSIQVKHCQPLKCLIYLLKWDNNCVHMSQNFSCL